MKRTIGLVLGGGGAKGAYQVGVLKALKEYRLLKHVEYISATSIGALNSIKVLENDIDGAIDIWKNINMDVAMGKLSFASKLRTKSIFSREGFKQLANEKMDLDKASKSKVKCYVLATPLTKKVKDAPTEFLVNGKSKEDILSYLLASSAIPIVFEPVTINGIKYMDGYGVSNTPVETLKNKGCNVIFVVPLKDTSDAYIYSDDDTLIVDFVSTTNNQGIKDGTLNFVSDRCIERMNYGYKVGVTLIEKLIKERVIAINWYQKIILTIKSKFSKIRKDNYYRLSKDEIEKALMKDSIF